MWVGRTVGAMDGAIEPPGTDLRRVLPTHTVPPSSQTTQSRLLLLTLPWLEAGAGLQALPTPPTTVGWADAALQLGVDADLITLETCLPTTPDTHP